MYVQVLEGHGASAVLLDVSNLEAEPRDLSALGHLGDPRTLDKVVDGVAVTNNDTHMWLVPFTPGGEHYLTIDLGRVRELIGLWQRPMGQEGGSGRSI